MSRRGLSGPRSREVQQYYDRECTVLIWRTGSGRRALKHPGHASIMLRCNRNRGPWHVAANALDGPLEIRGGEHGPDNIRHISFFPGADFAGGAGMREQFFGRREG